MRLYTEEQVREMLSIAKHTYELIDDIINEFNEIELPTDEEIEKEAPFLKSTFGFEQGQYQGFIMGAKWMQKRMSNKGGDQ